MTQRYEAILTLYLDDPNRIFRLSSFPPGQGPVSEMHLSPGKSRWQNGTARLSLFSRSLPLSFDTVVI